MTETLPRFETGSRKIDFHVEDQHVQGKDNDVETSRKRVRYEFFFCLFRRSIFAVVFAVEIQIQGRKGAVRVAFYVVSRFLLLKLKFKDVEISRKMMRNAACFCSYANFRDCFHGQH